MRLPGDDRAVSAQIGAVLLLAIFVLAFSQYQIDAVPDQNRGVERDHNERVTGELIELRDSITAAGYRNGTRGTTVTLGTQYESRILAQNPLQPAGTLRTGEANNVTIEGVDGLDEPLESKPIVYEPDYNEYSTAPTTRIEHTAVLHEFEGGVVTVEEPTVVTADDGTVIVPIVDGALAETTSGTVSVEIEPVETYRTESAGDGVTIAFETAHPEAWDDLEGWEGDEDAGEATFDGDVEAVVIAHVAVGDASERSDANDAIATYGESFVASGGGSASGSANGDGIDIGVEPGAVPKGQEETLEVTVTDDGEGIANAQVNFATGSDGGLEIVGESTAETNENGVAEVTVRGDEIGSEVLYASALGSTERLDVEVEGPFESVRVDDVEEGSQGDTSQRIEIVLSGDLEAGEEIEIDLSDAQSEPGNNGRDGVDYDDAEATVTGGSGSVPGGLEANRGQGSATLTYVAGDGDVGGDSIRIDVTGYVVDGDENAPYTVEFARVTTDGTDADEFDVVPG